MKAAPPGLPEDRHRAPLRDRGRAAQPRRDRLRVVQLLLAVLGAGVLVGLVRRYGAGEILSLLAQVRPGWLVVYAAIVATIFLGYAVRWQFLLRALDESVALPRIFGVRLAGLAVGSLTPGAKLGGEPLRAWMIAADGVRPGAAIASVVVDRGVELLANIAFAVGYCALFAARDGAMAARVLLVIAASGIAFVVGVLAMARRLRRGASLVPARFVPVIERLGGTRAAVAETDDALRALIFGHRRLMFWAVASALVLNALVLAEYAALFRAFGADPSLPELAGSLLGVGLAHALPVPASLGALEGAQVAAMHLAGGDTRLQLIAATVARLRDLVWTLPGVAYLGIDGFRRGRRRPGPTSSGPGRETVSPGRAPW